ncbi:YhcN/YlaJ family sporulation lipoprotein [Paenibacillus sp.]|uniref:YhcN/YlaJ family sporulation lipoprotein n=1 Tax=Paenibacillus sp. TaxID=58172 RepID=UPI0028113E6C|nr:YhcN/YlaJ family sporulation lipoprotein [Paenibacillus sp.]
MLKKLLRVTVIGASVLALAACGGQNDAGNMSQNGYRTNQTGAGQGIRGATDYGNHNNRNLRINRDIARAIERIDGISRARVVMGESNAYVAVETNENAGNSPALGGSNARSSANASEFGMRGNYYGVTDSRVFPRVGGRDGVGTTSLEEAGSAASAPNMYGTNARGAGRGLNGGSEISGYSGGDGNPGGFLSGLGRMFGLNGDRNDRSDHAGGTSGAAGMTGTNGMTGTTGAAGGTGMTGTTGANGAMGSAGMNGGNAGNYGVTGTGRSGRIGLNPTGMNGTDDANSQYMHNGGQYGQLSAYNNNNGLSMQVRARVESIVRSLAPNVRNVYVSSDESFMQRLGTYKTNSFGGRDGESLVSQFNEFVGRIFNGDNDTNRYDMQNGYDQRNRNGVTRLMDNSFDRNNPRHNGGGVTGTGTGMNQAQAGTLGSAR